MFTFTEIGAFIVRNLVTIATLVGFGLIIAAFLVKKKTPSSSVAKPTGTTPPESTPESKDQPPAGRDIRIGPKRAVALWPIVTLIASAIMVVLLWLVVLLLAWLIGVPTSMNSWMALGILVLALAAFGRREPVTLKVPETGAQPMTFIGSSTIFGRTPLLTEGLFAWWGSRLLIAPWDLTGRKGIEDFVIKGMVNGVERWFFSTIAMPLKIWNSGHEKNVELIAVNSKNGVELKVTLTLELLFVKIGAALRNGNLALTIAERARTTIRTAAGYFTALDIAVVKDLLRQLVMGETIVTCFLTKEVRNFPLGSIVRDLGGEPQLMVVERRPLGDGTRESQEEAVIRTAIEFKEWLRKNGLSTPMVNAIKDEGGNIVVEVRHISDPLAPILERIGAQLLAAAVGIVDLPQAVKDAAAAVETQAAEAEVQTSGALAAKAAARILRPDPDEVADGRHFDRVVLAQVLDPGNKSKNARFIHLSGNTGGNAGAAAILAAANEKD